MSEQTPEMWQDALEQKAMTCACRFEWQPKAATPRHQKANWTSCAEQGTFLATTTKRLMQSFTCPLPRSIQIRYCPIAFFKESCNSCVKT